MTPMDRACYPALPCRTHRLMSIACPRTGCRTAKAQRCTISPSPGQILCPASSIRGGIPIYPSLRCSITSQSDLWRFHITSLTGHDSIEVFFNCDPCGSRVLHRPAFLASMRLPPKSPGFPHSAVLHAIVASMPHSNPNVSDVRL